MNAMIKKTEAAIAAYGERGPFEAYAESAAPRTILGRLLRFSKGDFLTGEDDEPVENGALFVAGVDHLLVGWILWQGAKPVEQIMMPVALGQAPPRRDDLGHHDQTQWERDSKGEPRDPWAYTAYLPLLAEAGSGLHTFTTSSRGGHGALGELSRAYARHRRKEPGLLPRIALNVDSYQHSKREYGRVKVPNFTVIGWQPSALFNDALREAGVEPIEPARPPTFAQEMDDEIPF